MVFYSFLAVFILLMKCFAFEMWNLPAQSHSQFPGPEMDQSIELGSISNLAVKLLLLAGRHWSVTSHKPSALHLDTSGRAPQIQCWQKCPKGNNPPGLDVKGNGGKWSTKLNCWSHSRLFYDSAGNSHVLLTWHKDVILGWCFPVYL